MNKVSKHTSARLASRLKKKIRIQKTIKGTLERPRLVVYRSGKHVYAQIVNDVQRITLASACSLKFEKSSSKEAAKKVGLAVAKAALEKKISNVVFDRNGYLYHGRIQSLADGAREGGLNF